MNHLLSLLFVIAISSQFVGTFAYGKSFVFAKPSFEKRIIVEKQFEQQEKPIIISEPKVTLVKTKEPFAIGKVIKGAIVGGTIGAVAGYKKPKVTVNKVVTNVPKYIVKPVTKLQLIPIKTVTVAKPKPIYIKKKPINIYKPLVKVAAFKAVKAIGFLAKKSIVTSKKLIAAKLPKPKVFVKPVIVKPVAPKIKIYKSIKSKFH